MLSSETPQLFLANRVNIKSVKDASELPNAFKDLINKMMSINKINQKDGHKYIF